MMFPFLLLTIVIKIVYLIKNEKGPLFYKQTRIGLNGRRFEIYKYRTMSPDAEEELKELLKDDEYKTEWDEYHKFRNDPRITPLGLFLRRSSLDEFPQFLGLHAGRAAAPVLRARSWSDLAALVA